MWADNYLLVCEPRKCHSKGTPACARISECVWAGLCACEYTGLHLGVCVRGQVCLLGHVYVSCDVCWTRV